MAQTSVHVAPCSGGASEIHNRREKKLDYVKKELTPTNESFSYIDHSLPAEEAIIRKTVKEETGRKLQKNSQPLLEAVVVIDQKTTMEDLQRYCERCYEQFNLIPLQIHIHRDEGHHRAKAKGEDSGWKPNLHAHIVWRKYGYDGKSVKLQRQDCRDLQTLAAEVLNMERGVSSDVKHLNAVQYKLKKQEEQIEKLESNITVAMETLKGAYAGAKQGVSDIFTGNARKRAEEAEKRLKETLEDMKALRDKTMESLSKAKEDVQRANERKEQLLEWVKVHKEELNEVEDLKERLFKTENRAIKAENALSRVEDIQKYREGMIERFVEYGALKRQQWNNLFKGYAVETQSILVSEQQVSLDNSIHLRIDGKNKHKLEIFDQHWCSEEGFWNGIKKGITAAFNAGSRALDWVRNQLGGGCGLKR